MTLLARGAHVAHADLKAAVLVELSRRGLFVWSSPCGAATPLGTERPMRFGLPGQPDIMGILPGGRFVGLEIKTGTGRQSLLQHAWQARCERAGGLYIVVRDLGDLCKLPT